jgi:hypothetical protein
LQLNLPGTLNLSGLHSITLAVLIPRSEVRVVDAGLRRFVAPHSFVGL